MNIKKYKDIKKSLILAYAVVISAIMVSYVAIYTTGKVPFSLTVITVILWAAGLVKAKEWGKKQ